MEYLNHKITEAVCAFTFEADANEWDLSSYSEYYNLIKSKGFKLEHEKIPVQLSFEINNLNQLPKPEISEGKLNMVFSHQVKQYAIILGENHISFHAINHYDGWEIFYNDFIIPCMEDYISLGYGNGILNSQMLYVSNFNIKTNENLADYLNFVPNMQDFGEGNENAYYFQSNFSINPNLQLNLKTVFRNDEASKRKVTLECNCLAFQHNKTTWQILINQAHDKAKEAFIKVISSKFKTQIK